MASFIKRAGTIILLLVSITTFAKRNNLTDSMEHNNSQVHYRKIDIDGTNIFYREAGQEGAPVILLMHGYPTSSFMFRNLIPKLSSKFHVIAPDLPGFGFSDFPSGKTYAYTFDHFAETMQGFIDKLALHHFAIYIFDYGAPVGLRLAMKNPEKITGIISQDGNAYEQGLLDWSHGLVKAYWDHNTTVNRDALRKFFTIEGTNFQYREGVKDPSLIAPEAIALDQSLMDRPGNVEMQLDLLLDYKNNVKMYPQFQAYIRQYKPKMLVVWGIHDPYFSTAGAEGFKKDNPNAIVKFYDTGHFVLETHAKEVAQDVYDFLLGL